MSEVYRDAGFHNRTREYEEETDCFMRRVELPLEVLRALASHAQDMDSTPIDAINRFTDEWMERQEENPQFEANEVNTGWPYDCWRQSKKSGLDELEQEELPRTILQYLVLSGRNLTGILSYAEANQTTPSEVTAEIILEGLQVAPS